MRRWTAGVLKTGELRRLEHPWRIQRDGLESEDAFLFAAFNHFTALNAPVKDGVEPGSPDNSPGEAEDSNVLEPDQQVTEGEPEAYINQAVNGNKRIQPPGAYLLEGYKAIIG